MSGFFNNLTPDQASLLFDAGAVVLTVCFPAAAVYIQALRKGKDALIDHLKESPEDNAQIVQRALDAGKQRLANELQKKLPL